MCTSASATEYRILAPITDSNRFSYVANWAGERQALVIQVEPNSFGRQLLELAEIIEVTTQTDADASHKREIATTWASSLVSGLCPPSCQAYPYGVRWYLTQGANA